MSCQQIKQTRIELVQGDITLQEVDAIVNAANNSLLGGGGVDGAIHRAAGPQLLAECRTLKGCDTGDAKLTKGYRLAARHVIHTVGPVYGTPNAPQLLASAYRRSMEVAAENNIRTIAFPAISTGVYGYPLAEAAPIAIHTVIDSVKNGLEIDLVRFVLFTSNAQDAFKRALEDIAAHYDDLVPCD
ncbi:O-acetyl-ADP-ribose deacetylase [Phototrophicus methaneseepsis]|uniref:O-acetyl-ADP-ribose deacetylase n=1 Tax=Phototrophicus methaneseepsis TaxID=2710758 RepID=A0A7S8ED58_9CHLR|nr:O-acetyl-ADP-ribose deacetylase [Phototrophicus methaneseepsis]QPC84771.1 O-acetyl-ADP-ribose deacetylase [Phototrophicus methaneseepsis]